jgi:hypothetical protein
MAVSHHYREGFNYTQIVVSLTTSPTRIDFIEPVIQNLENQTLKPSKIVVNVPHIFKRTNAEFTKIPDFLTKNPRVTVNRCEDIGPATKIIPTAELYANEPDTMMISIDDDISYTTTFVETLVKYANKYPDSAITGESFMRLPHKKNDPKTNYAQLVEGYSSVLYRKRFFDNFSVETLKKYPKFCYFADDFILSNHLNKENIPIVVVDSKEKMIENAYLDYGSQSDALKNGANGHTNGNIDNYSKCAAHLKSSGELFIDYSF